MAEARRDSQAGRRLEELSAEEAMLLLGRVSVGRVVFTSRALPAIRPVNHIVDGDHIIIRTDSGAAVVSAIRSDGGTVVAYEADQVDPLDHVVWSVTVLGVARQVSDPEAAAAYRKALRPWVPGAKDQVISIHAQQVTGFRLVIDETEPGQTHQLRE